MVASLKTLEDKSLPQLSRKNKILIFQYENRKRPFFLVNQMIMHYTLKFNSLKNYVRII